MDDGVQATSNATADRRGKKPRSGVAKFGNRKHSALAAAIPAGATLSICLGASAASVGSHDLAWGWAFLIFVLCLFPVSMALAWVLIVDRDTIPGANRSPEDNVENAWFSKAAETTTFVTFAVAGVGSAVATFVQPDLIAIPFTLLGVCAFMTLTFAVAYFWEKSR